MIYPPSDSPIARNRRERRLAWLLFLVALGLAALVAGLAPVATVIPPAIPTGPAPHE